MPGGDIVAIGGRCHGGGHHGLHPASAVPQLPVQHRAGCLRKRSGDGAGNPWTELLPASQRDGAQALDFHRIADATRRHGA